MDNQKNWDVIVIGSGLGGMSCASSLARFGHKVLLLEQHFVAGGMTHTFNRAQFHWDVGVHCLGEMEENRSPYRLLQWLSQGKIKMNKYSDVYDTFYFPDGEKFELPASYQKFKDSLISRFKEEEEGILKYLDLVKKVGKGTKELFLTRSFPKWADTLFGSFFRKNFNQYSQVTTKEIMDRFFKDEKLKTLLCGQWGYYGAPPSDSSFFIHAVTVRHFWNGGYYPQGSSEVFAQEILKAVKEKGQVLLKKSVKKLIVDKNRVTGVELDNGEQYFAPIVVSAIGAKATANRLILPYQSEIKDLNWATSISKLKQSPCHVCLYIGYKGDIEKAGATASNQWFFETWDMEDTEWDVSKSDSIAPVLYVSFPSLKNPSHDQKSDIHTGEVVTFVPYQYFEKWKESRVGRRGDDYKVFKKDLAERILKQFLSHRPDLKDKVVFSELSTPLSTEHYCRAPQGAIYGLYPDKKRFECLDLRPQTSIKGFYMAGSDVGTLGVVGAMYGGVLAAATIDRRILKILAL